MEKVSVDQVRSAIAEHGITQWRLRECSICGAGLHYLFRGDEVAFQGSCDCGGWSPPRLTSYDDVAETLNMQRPHIRAQMWVEMLGLPVSAPVVS